MQWDRVVNRWRVFVDRVYLTGVFLGPRALIHVGSNVIVGVFFALKGVHLIHPPEWLSALGFAFLFANVAYSVYLQRRTKLGRFPRGDSEARPPP